jgi:signal peptidase I
MEPTLLFGDRQVVNKLSVPFGTIHVGGVIVLKAPPSENGGEPVADLVKHVIGVVFVRVRPLSRVASL